jgi:membrane-associated phospholipid phosphatase
MDLYLLRDYIGLFAPIILCLLSLFLLRNNKKYLYFFFYGFILNHILNIILKVAIKEPRPTTKQKVIEIGITNEARISFDNFGMPSGHAQSCAYCLAFITMVLKDPFITAIYTVITFNTLFQRYLYNRHTILQLIVGSFIGLCFGYIFYTIANKNIIGNIKMKKDDNAPL